MTPAINQLIKTKTEHTVHSYEHNPNASSYGLEAIAQMQVNAMRLFKTLIVELTSSTQNLSIPTKDTLAVAIVPIEQQLSLKQLAKVANAKKAIMAAPEKVVRSTGYVLGGVSPLGQKNQLPTFIEHSAKRHNTIFVSAGRRGLEIELYPQSLRCLTDGLFAYITQ